MTLAFTLIAAALVGLVLGLLGGGGSILTVPALMYLAHVPARSAITTSLFVVAVTSLAGLVGHAWAGGVRGRVGGGFAAAGMVGAYGGGRLAQFVPAALLLVGFAAMMAVTAVAMLRPRQADRATAADPVTADPSATGRSVADGDRTVADRGRADGGAWRRAALVTVQGAGVGAATGLVGAGGGFLVVPALVLLGGLEMPAAVGTSLLVLTAQSAAGFVGHLHGAWVNWSLALEVSAVAVVAALLAARWSARVDAAVLQRVFGGFVAVMAAVVLAGQLPAGWLHLVLTPQALATAAAGALLLAGVGLVRHRRSEAGHRDPVAAVPGAGAGPSVGSVPVAQPSDLPKETLSWRSHRTHHSTTR